MVHQQFHAGFANSFEAGTNSSAGFRDLFVSRASDTFLKVHEPRSHEYRMSMRIDKSREDHLAGAVDLDNLFSILLDPGIAQCVFRLAGGDDFLSYAQNRGILDDAEFSQVSSAARPGLSGSRAQGQQPADIYQQQCAIGCAVFR